MQTTIRARRPFWAIALGVVTVFVVFIVSSFLLIAIWLVRAPRRWENAVVWHCNPILCRALGVKAIVYNRELYSPTEPCIVITNHSSNADIPIIYMATSGSLRMLSKHEMFLIPFMGWGMRVAHFVGVKRGKRSSGEQAQRLIGKLLRDGFQFFIAPEGTRSPDGRLLPFKPGAFRLAKMHKVPILVLALESPWQLLPKGQLLPLYKGQVKATFLARLEVGERNADEMAKEARAIYLKHGFAQS